MLEAGAVLAHEVSFDSPGVPTVADCYEGVCPICGGANHYNHQAITLIWNRSSFRNV